jgi:hypothetical protein
VDGVFALITAFRVRETHRRWWALLLEGLLGIAVGIMALASPGVATVALLYALAAWAIATGILEIITAVRFADQMDHEWLLGLTGVAPSSWASAGAESGSGHLGADADARHLCYRLWRPDGHRGHPGAGLDG